jgi:hypothetical protein
MRVTGCDGCCRTDADDRFGQGPPVARFHGCGRNYEPARSSTALDVDTARARRTSETQRRCAHDGRQAASSTRRYCDGLFNVCDGTSPKA